MLDGRHALMIGLFGLLTACGSSDAGEKASAGGGLSATSPAGGSAGSSALNASSGASGSSGSSPGSGSGGQLTGLRAEMLQQVNAVRASGADCGGNLRPAVAPLQWNDLAESAALGHSQYLQTTNTFSHTGSAGSSVGTRLTVAGYTWSSVGENIAAGQPSVTGVVQAWVASAGHCENLMNGTFVDIGVALVNGASGNTYANYWTMVLARSK